MFHGYVKVFQSESPLIHTLHPRMVDVTKELLGMFIRPEHIPDRVSKLMQIDLCDKSLQKSDKDMSVGKYAYADLNKARLDKTCCHWISKLYIGLRTGYILAAKKMLQLPLANRTLRYLSVLDPDFVGHSQVELSLKKLGDMLPATFSDDERGKLSMEASKFNTDVQVKTLADNYTEKERIDIGFWSKVFNLKDFTTDRYPTLKKLVTSMLTIFSGPLVESTFNIMDDIVEKDRTKLTVVNYEAIAIIKTTLRKQNVKSTDLKVSPDMKKACIQAYNTYQTYLKQKKENEEVRAREKLNASLMYLKLEKAKRLAKLMKLKNRTIAKNTKRPAERSVSSERRWKRIRCEN